MKKILTVSLGALLIATAANAEIASVDYVTGQLANKQDTITDLDTIRDGAALGATAVQNLSDLDITATATELNYVDGVTSSIQTQLDSKQAKLNYTAENAANKVVSVSSSSTDAQYPSAKAMHTALSKKQNASQIGTVTAANMGTTATTVVAAISEVAGEAAAAQTTANAAQAAADAAQTTANTASASASSANNKITAMDLAAVGADGSYIKTVSQADGKVTAAAEAADTTPTSASTKMVTSGGVYTALGKKVNIKQNTADAGKGLVVDGTTGNLTLTDIATQAELNTVANTAAAGQTATQVSTAITSAINNLDVASVGGDGKFIITIEQEDGKIEAAAKSFVTSLSDGVLDAPTTNAVYDALALKQNSSLGSTAANKAVITNASGNITSGTIATGMIATGAVNSDKIADGTITNGDIASGAAIAQSKISGLTTDLAGKQQVVSGGVEGNFYVAAHNSTWKDMFAAMPKDTRCEEEGIKCALTHESGAYAWEVVRE